MNWKFPECAVSLERLSKKMLLGIPGKSINKLSSRHLIKEGCIRKHSKENSAKDRHKKQSLQNTHSSYALYKQQREKFLSRRNRIVHSKTVTSSPKTEDSSSKTPGTLVTRTSNAKTLTSKNPSSISEVVNSSSETPTVNVITKKSTRASSHETLVPDLKKSLSAISSSVQNSKVPLKSKFLESSKTFNEVATTRTSAKTRTSSSKQFHSGSKTSSLSSSNVSSLTSKTSDSCSEIVNSSSVISTVKFEASSPTRKSKFPSDLKNSSSTVPSPGQSSGTSLKKVLTKSSTHSKSSLPDNNIASLPYESKTSCLKNKTPTKNLKKTVSISKNDQCQRTGLNRSHETLSSNLKASSSTTFSQTPNSKTKLQKCTSEKEVKKKGAGKVYIKILSSTSRTSSPDIISSLPETAIADLMTKPFTRSSSFEKLSSNRKSSSASSKSFFPKSKEPFSSSKTANSSVKNSVRNSVSDDLNSKTEAACSSMCSSGSQTVQSSLMPAVQKSKAPLLRYETKKLSETHITNVSTRLKDFKKKSSTHKISVKDSFALHSKNSTPSIKSAAEASSNISCLKSRTSTANLQNVSLQLSSQNQKRSLSNSEMSKQKRTAKCKVQTCKSKLSSLRPKSSISKPKPDNSTNSIATHDAILTSCSKSEISESIILSCDIPASTCKNGSPSKSGFSDNRASNSKMQDLHSKVSVSDSEVLVSPSNSSIQISNRKSFIASKKPVGLNSCSKSKASVTNSISDSKLPVSACTNSAPCSKSQFLSLSKSKGEFQTSALSVRNNKEIRDEKKPSAMLGVLDACKKNVDKHSLVKTNSPEMKDNGQNIAASAPLLRNDAGKKNSSSSKLSVFNKTHKNNSIVTPHVLGNKDKSEKLTRLAFNKKRKHDTKTNTQCSNKQPMKKPCLGNYPDKNSDLTSEKNNSVSQNSEPDKTTNKSQDTQCSKSLSKKKPHLGNLSDKKSHSTRNIKDLNHASFQTNCRMKSANINTKNRTSSFLVPELQAKYELSNTNKTKTTPKKRKSESKDCLSDEEKDHNSVVKSPVKRPRIENFSIKKLDAISTKKGSDFVLQKSTVVNSSSSEIQNKCQETTAVSPSKRMPKCQKSNYRNYLHDSKFKNNSSASSLNTSFENQSVKKSNVLCTMKAASSATQPTQSDTIHDAESSSSSFQSNASLGSNSNLTTLNMITDQDDMTSSSSSSKFQNKSHECKVSYGSKVTAEATKFEIIDDFSRIHCNSPDKSKLKDLHIENCSEEVLDIFPDATISNSVLQNAASFKLNHDVNIVNASTDTMPSSDSLLSQNNCQESSGNPSKMMTKSEKSKCPETVNQFESIDNHAKKIVSERSHFQNGSLKVSHISDTKTLNSASQNADSSTINSDVETLCTNSDISPLFLPSDFENKSQESSDVNHATISSRRKSEIKEDLDSSENSLNSNEKCPLQRLEFKNSTAEKSDDIFNKNTADFISTATPSEVNHDVEINKDTMSSMLSPHKFQNKCPEFNAVSCLMMSPNKKYSESKEHCDSSENDFQSSEKSPVKSMEFHNNAVKKMDTVCERESSKSNILNPVSIKINHCVGASNTHTDKIPSSPEFQNKCSELSSIDKKTPNEKKSEYKENADSKENCDQSLAQSLSRSVQGETSKCPPESSTSTVPSWGTSSNTSSITNRNSLSHCKSSIALPSDSFSAESTLINKTSIENIAKENNIFQFSNTNLKSTSSSVKKIEDTKLTVNMEKIFCASKSPELLKSPSESQKFSCDVDLKMTNKTTKQPKSDCEVIVFSLLQTMVDSISEELDKNKFWKICKCCFTPFGTYKETCLICSKCDSAGISSCIPTNGLSQDTIENMANCPKTFSTKFTQFELVQKQIAKNFSDFMNKRLLHRGKNIQKYEECKKSVEGKPLKKKSLLPNKMLMKEKNQNIGKKKHEVAYQDNFIKGQDKDIAYLKMPVFNNSIEVKTQPRDDLLPNRMPVKVQNQKADAQHCKKSVLEIKDKKKDAIKNIKYSDTVNFQKFVLEDKDKKQDEMKNTECIDTVHIKKSVLEDKDKKRDEIKDTEYIDTVHSKKFALEDKREKQNKIKNTAHNDIAFIEKSILEDKGKNQYEIKNIEYSDSVSCKKSMLDDKDKKQDEMKNTECIDIVRSKKSVLEDKDKKQDEIKDTECIDTAHSKKSALEDKGGKQNEIKNTAHNDIAFIEKSILEDKGKNQDEIKNIEYSDSVSSKKSMLEDKSKKQDEIKNTEYINTAHNKKSEVEDIEEQQDESKNIEYCDTARCKKSVVEDKDKKENEIENTECFSELPVIVSAYSTNTDHSDQVGSDCHLAEELLEQVDDQKQEENANDFHFEMLPVNEQGENNSHLELPKTLNINAHEQKVEEVNIASESIELCQNSNYFLNSSPVANSSVCTNILYVANPTFQNQISSYNTVQNLNFSPMIFSNQNQIVSYNALQNVNYSSPMQADNPLAMLPNTIVNDKNSVSCNYILEPPICSTKIADCHSVAAIDSPVISSDESLSVPVITSVISLSDENYNNIQDNTKSLNAETHVSDNSLASEEFKIQIVDVVSLKSENCHASLDKNSQFIEDKEEFENVEEIDSRTLNKFSLQFLNNNSVEPERPLESRLERKKTKKNKKFAVRFLSPSKKLKSHLETAKPEDQNKMPIEFEEECTDMPENSMELTNTEESFECTSKILSPSKQPPNYVEPPVSEEVEESEVYSEVSDMSANIPENSDQREINEHVLGYANANKQAANYAGTPVLKEHDKEYVAYPRDSSESSETKSNQTVLLQTARKLSSTTEQEKSKNCILTSGLKIQSPDKLESAEAISDVFKSSKICNLSQVTEEVEGTDFEETKNVHDKINIDFETTSESSGEKEDNVVVPNVINNLESSEISCQEVSSSSENKLAKDVKVSTLKETSTSVSVLDSMNDAEFVSEPVSEEFSNKKNNLHVEKSTVNETASSINVPDSMNDVKVASEPVLEEFTNKINNLDVKTSTLNETIVSVNSINNMEFTSEPVSVELTNETNNVSDTSLTECSHVNEENKVKSDFSLLTIQETEQSFNSLLIQHPSLLSPYFNRVISRNKILSARLFLDAFSYMAELDIKKDFTLHDEQINRQKNCYTRLLNENPPNFIKLRDFIYGFSVRNVVDRCVKLFKTFEKASEFLLKNPKVTFTAFPEKISEDERVLALSSLLENFHRNTDKIVSDVIEYNSAEMKSSSFCGLSKTLASDNISGEIPVDLQYETISDNDLFEPLSETCPSNMEKVVAKSVNNNVGIVDVESSLNSEFFNNMQYPPAHFSVSKTKTSLENENNSTNGFNETLNDSEKELQIKEEPTDNIDSEVIPSSKKTDSTETFLQSPTISLSNQNAKENCSTHEKSIEDVRQFAQNDATQNASKSPAEFSTRCEEGISIKEELQESINSSSQCSYADKSNAPPVPDLSSAVSETTAFGFQNCHTNETAQNILYSNNYVHDSQRDMSQDFNQPQPQGNSSFSYSQSNFVERTSTAATNSYNLLGNISSNTSNNNIHSNFQLQNHGNIQSATGNILMPGHSFNQNTSLPTVPTQIMDKSTVGGLQQNLQYNSSSGFNSTGYYDAYSSTSRGMNQVPLGNNYAHNVSNTFRSTSEMAAEHTNLHSQSQTLTAKLASSDRHPDVLKESYAHEAQYPGVTSLHSANEQSSADQVRIQEIKRYLHHNEPNMYLSQSATISSDSRTLTNGTNHLKSNSPQGSGSSLVQNTASSVNYSVHNHVAVQIPTSGASRSYSASTKQSMTPNSYVSPSPLEQMIQNVGYQNNFPNLVLSTSASTPSVSSHSSVTSHGQSCGTPHHSINTPAYNQFSPGNYINNQIVANEVHFHMPSRRTVQGALQAQNNCMPPQRQFMPGSAVASRFQSHVPHLQSRPDCRGTTVPSASQIQKMISLRSCALCQKPGKMVCKLCYKVSYCSEPCANYYWKVRHRVECRKSI